MSRNVMMPPPRPRPPPMVGAAEFLALRTIVMSLVAKIADQHEASGGGSAQDWINHIAVCCQEAILAATSDSGSGGDPERVRREAVEHINHILGGIHFPVDRDNAH